MNLSNSSKYRLQDIEKLLEDSLLPVKPTQQFILSLKEELLRKFSSSSSVALKEKNQTILLAIASVAGSSILIINTLRTVLSLIGVISVIHLLKQKPQGNTLSPPQIASG